MVIGYKVNSISLHSMRMLAINKGYKVNSMPSHNMRMLAIDTGYKVKSSLRTV